jgi:hypothetical protein
MRAARQYCAFDRLLEGLAHALLEAQRRCRDRHQSIVSACFEGNGQPRQLELPAHDGAPSLQIPLWQLRALQLPQIAQLSVSFDVELRVLQRGKGPLHLALQVALDKSSRHARHRLQIAFHGVNEPLGEVLVDGVRLHVWPLQSSAMTTKTETHHG